ncbi:Armadillo-type fold [Pseudocohnilembus persalinus]|uniref:Armadillo-type fold n=1 Tax=Pseudocohnilembus persalinus TaxID=266149 RepID=A0A0V0QE05_PSEPJ|nr:Armadillo-type fold [Pseudocohnilembus persalinus]|eukprot:KRX00431.1 Armadillo-type fold [Pseudocohnilembus persalinus]
MEDYYYQDIYLELKKRSPDQPLTFKELSELKKVQYKQFRQDPVFIQLLTKYSQDTKFQIRVCENSFLYRVLVPLMQRDNEKSVILAATQVLVYLSQNPETHQKILESRSLKPLKFLIEENLHYEITKNSIQILRNLVIPVFDDKDNFADAGRADFGQAVQNSALRRTLPAAAERDFDFVEVQKRQGNPVFSAENCRQSFGSRRSVAKTYREQDFRRQACKFISCLSWNQKFVQILIEHEVIDLLIISLNNNDKEQRIYSVFAMSNLSGSPDFHAKIKNINIKSLIKIFETEGTFQDGLRAVANSLANISLDQQFQHYFLKDPEKNILLRILKSSTDIILQQLIVIIFSNIANNPFLIPQLTQIEVLEIFLNLYKKNDMTLKGYTASIISSLSLNSEMKIYLKKIQFIKEIVSDIQTCTHSTSTKLLFSIIKMLNYSHDFHQEFLENNGLAVLLLFLNKKSDNFQAYLSCKALVILSKYKQNQQKLSEITVCTQIVNSSLVCKAIQKIQWNQVFFQSAFFQKTSNFNNAQWAQLASQKI